MNEFDEALAGLNAARGQVEGQVAAARARNEAIDQLADEVRRMSATASSPRGEVTVTALAAGGVTEVLVTAEGRELEASQLSEVITATIAQAQRAAADLAVARTAEVLGESSPIVSGLRSDVDATRSTPRDDGLGYS